MSADREFVRLRDRYALAKATKSRDVNVHYERLRTHTHGRLTHDVRLETARAQLRTAQDRVHRDCRTLRETLGFAEASQ
jgi:hypothetical protein